MSALEAVDVGFMRGKIPWQVIAFEVIATTAAFQIDLFQLLGDADIGFELRAGEIVGIAGVSGNGLFQCPRVTPRAS